jgi:transcriptional regulator GlxA family with amidase domain
MGISLVDYRNRLRIDRFFEAIQRSGTNTNLLDAALEAGFGSYAQFHRVYRKFVGTTPRDIFSTGAARVMPTEAATSMTPESVAALLGSGPPPGSSIQ